MVYRITSFLRSAGGGINDHLPDAPWRKNCNGFSQVHSQQEIEQTLSDWIVSSDYCIWCDSIDKIDNLRLRDEILVTALRKIIQDERYHQSHHMYNVLKIFTSIHSDELRQQMLVEGVQILRYLPWIEGGIWIGDTVTAIDFIKRFQPSKERDELIAFCVENFFRNYKGFESEKDRIRILFSYIESDQAKEELFSKLSKINDTDVRIILQ
jgi:hypothetical protein